MESSTAGAGGRLMRRCARAVPHALVVAVLGTGLVACGDGESYAVPEKLCGTPVKSRPLERLLPGGEKLTEKTSRGTNGTSDLPGPGSFADP
ncbi:hypothetical protein [Streptomyces qinglanensis]|nr:hypothetical protein [Streptomyces qinglanensis]